MFKTLHNALKMKDIRKKLLFTLGMLLVVRIGSQLPLPGIDNAAVKAFLQSSLGDSFNLINSFTGGSFLDMSIFALNVTPYITSSIIIQLLTIAIPALEELQKDGESGRKKMTEITRYVTIALGIIESLGLAITFQRQGLFRDMNEYLIIVSMVVTLTTGAALVMWIGERITEKGVGNGISIILLINIVSRMPGDFYKLYEKFVKGQAITTGIIAAVIIVLVILITTVLVVLLQDAERRIPVQYAKKMQGRKMMGAQGSHIPLKVNTAGVIPVIFASSIMQFPLIISNLFSIDLEPTGFIQKAIISLNQTTWFDADHPKRTLGLLIYIGLLIFFAYFYTSITFNPLEVANNMKKQGGFIPGIRPGKPTSEYLTQMLNYIIFIGACGLIIIAVIPIIASGVFSANVSFGGTSLIIVVGVILETIKQIESQMLVRHYKGFLND